MNIISAFHSTHAPRAPTVKNKPEQLPDGVSVSRFTGLNGSVEYHLTIQAPAGLPFDAQLEQLISRYHDALHMLHLAPHTAVFRRAFLSDARNQSQQVLHSPLNSLTKDNPVALSIVQQAPLSGAKIALLAYHIDSLQPYDKQLTATGHLRLTKNGVRHLWSTRLCVAASNAQPASEQTNAVFEKLVDALAQEGSNLRDHCVRTWLYLKNVDVFYQEMVTARTQLFTDHGLTRDTHYIASTGIEGTCSHQFDTILMDAYSIPDLNPAQLSWLNDFDRLCPTIDYNVTFERGTRIAWADRNHLYLSGTASIDNNGQVIHVGDALRQLDVALDNVDALLRSGGANLDDMQYLLVYLRDPADAPHITQRLQERLPDVPTLIVQGPVCRPEWLVEVEGVGIAPHHDPALPDF